jgi:hypothetical protein
MLAEVGFWGQSAEYQLVFYKGHMFLLEIIVAGA